MRVIEIYWTVCFLTLRALYCQGSVSEKLVVRLYYQLQIKHWLMALHQRLCQRNLANPAIAGSRSDQRKTQSHRRFQ